MDHRLEKLETRINPKRVKIRINRTVIGTDQTCSRIIHNAGREDSWIEIPNDQTGNLERWLGNEK